MLPCGKNKFETLVISANGQSYYFRIFLPNFPQFVNASLEYSWNARDFLDAINKIVNQEKAEPKRPPKFYETVFRELSQIGNSANLVSNFSSVEFRVTDPVGRNHKLLVHLPFDYPETALTGFEHELPLTNLSNWETAVNFTGMGTLLDCHKQFCTLIDAYQSFWEVMENFDANCSVIEPQKPLLSDYYRRVQLTETCTALLTFNPLNPSQRPVIEFRGPDDEITGLRNTLESHLMDNDWDPEVDIHLNLLSVLDLDHFPCKEAVDEFALIQIGECGICFEERLNGEPANQRCDNALCKSQYHQFCLLKYLSSSLNSVRVINVVMGRCPTCKAMIGCPQ